MRIKSFTVTSGTAVFPTNYRGGTISMSATPAGGGDYTVEYTLSNTLDSSITPNWIAITAMTGATTQQTAELGSISAIRATLNSGTSVTIDINQSDA